MGKEVAILGVGMTKFGRITGRPLVDMAKEAGLMALRDAGLSYRDIQVGFCAHCLQPIGTGHECFSQLGMTGIPVTNVEVACLSHSRGVTIAADLIASGVYDTAMVIGIEKMPRGGIPFGDRTDMAYEFMTGIVPMPGGYAMDANLHMHKYGTKPEHFGKAAEKAHRNGSLNPNATYQDVYNLDEIMNSRMICDPITLLMCSANADGATATVLASMNKAKEVTSSPVRMVGWGAGNPRYNKEDPRPLIEGPHADVANHVYESSGIGPEEVNVLQLHDAFAVAEVYLLEELGFVPEGKGGPFVWEGNTEIDGQIPVNTDGGLTSCGHPIGATGGRMIAEILWQLRGMAGKRQVPGNPKVGMVENHGIGGVNVMMFKI